MFKKGQIKSEWIYEDIDFPKYHLKYLEDFCPESLFEVYLKSSRLWVHMANLAFKNVQKNLVESSYI
jgi:hypothetical protein